MATYNTKTTKTEVKLIDLESMHPYIISCLTQNKTDFGTRYVAIVDDYLDETFGEHILNLNATQAGTIKAIMQMDGTAILLKIGVNVFTNKEGKEFESVVVSGMSQEQYRSFKA